MRLLRAATFITPEPDKTAALYQQWFDYRLVESGVVSQALSQSWDAPAMAGRRFTVLAPASGAQIFLRFVQGVAPAGYVPLRTYGWAAAEICVRDVQAVFARMQVSPFEIIGPPKALDGAPTIWPMQVQGPDGEVLFLTEIRGDQADARLPRASSLVDCLFILVLACQDIAAVRHWFANMLGFKGGPDIELAYTTLSRAFGLPATHKHKIAVLTDAPNAFLEIDQYPAMAQPRDVKPGELPPGLAIASFAVPSLRALPGAATLPQSGWHDGVFYGGGASLVLRMPEGALVELIEAPTQHDF